MKKFEALTNATTVYMFAETYYATGCNHLSSYPGYYEITLHLPCDEYDWEQVQEHLEEIVLAGCKFEIRHQTEFNINVLSIIWNYEE